MKGTPIVLGGSLTSKPTWSSTSGCSATSAFFVFGRADGETHVAEVGHAARKRKGFFFSGGIFHDGEKEAPEGATNIRITVAKK
jgi:hypothetical protein